MVKNNKTVNKTTMDSDSTASLQKSVQPTMLPFRPGPGNTEEEMCFADRVETRLQEAVTKCVDEAIGRLQTQASSAGAATPTPPTSAKAKVQSIPSLSSIDDATERSSARRELEGYLPSMSSLTRAPLTALKEVRAELQKAFPEVSGGFSFKSNGITKDEDTRHTKLPSKLWGSPLMKAQLNEAETDGNTLDAMGSLDGTWNGSTLFDQFEASRKREMDAKFKEMLGAQVASSAEQECQHSAVSTPATNNLANGKSNLHSLRAPLAKKEAGPPRTRALPFAATSDFQNPETFEALNNRLKTGSRLSAAITTSLENKADFRARWESLNTALPRDVNAQDFVRLVTPDSSPTKPAASTPKDSSTKGPSASKSPWGSISFNPPESLTDYYNRRFESLGAEAKELIMKAQKNLMSPAVHTTKSFDPADFTKPFCEFLTENPTVFHAVDYFATKLTKAGFEKLSERDLWNDKLKAGGKYFVERNGSSLVAFSVGKAYKSGNGVAMIAGHVDALAARLKPVSTKSTKAGYVQLGVAPYAGSLNATWWDRDLGVGGRVLVKDPETGKIKSKLVKLGWPIARIPTLAPHFGVGMMGTNNTETQAVPIIGLDNSDLSSISEEEDAKWKASALLGGEGTFAATQPPKLLKAIAGELNIQNYSSIVNWELELFDTQAAQVGGLEKEFIFAGRVDDKLCSWSAIEALLAASEDAPEDAGIVNLVGVFDDEEIGSLLRQGAKGNFLPSVIERISESFSDSRTGSSNLLSQTYANSFLISADVTHAVNPNFLEKYLENHAPRLNVGVVVSADSNGHMTTDSVSTAVMQRIAEKCGSVLQLFMIRNDSRSGGTVGPMLSSAMGVRAIDMGIPQLSMHSIRATTGSLDPGLGIKLFKGFFEGFEAVDKEFE